jgi:hypothetical protein
MTNDEWTTFVATTNFGDLGLSAEANWFIEQEPGVWMQHLHCDRDTAVRIAVAVVDLILPEWKENHPEDTTPLRAVDAARKNPSTENQDLRKHAKSLAKACGDSRRRSMGYYHRIAEAARAVANAASASTDSAAVEAVSEALSKTEEHILYQLSVDAVYGKETEVRRNMLFRAVEVLRSFARPGG